MVPVRGSDGRSSNVAKESLRKKMVIGEREMSVLSRRVKLTMLRRDWPKYDYDPTLRTEASRV